MHVAQTEHEVAKKHEEKRTPSAGEPSLGWDKAQLSLTDKSEAGDLASWLADVKKVEGREIFNYSPFNRGKAEWARPPFLLFDRDRYRYFFVCLFTAGIITTLTKPLQSHQGIQFALLRLGKRSLHEYITKASVFGLRKREEQHFQ